MSEPIPFTMEGGLDQETSPLTIPPGRVIAALNYESVNKGYQRCEGYERFDGHPSPSDAAVQILTFSAGVTEIEVGDTVTGATSGATGRALADATLTSGTWNGVGAGYVPLHYVVGAFTPGEALQVAGVTRATLSASVATDGTDSAEHRGYVTTARNFARALIQPVPGAGPVRGVLWYAGKLTAWRNNAAQTAGVAHQNSANGWVQPNLGSVLTFKDGVSEIFAGNVITGTSSGNTATVRYIATDPQSDWCRNAAGSMILDNATGPFTANEMLTVAGVDSARAAAASSPATFPPGGRYDFTIHNFYATTGFERAYGANGVGRAFEFNGSGIIPINTGMPDDKPFLTKAHKGHLFLAFPKGSLQHSDLGSPLQVTGVFGASELGLGHEITNITSNAGSTLLITTTSSISLLSGNDSSDWVLDPLTDEGESGAYPYTAQRIGEIIYLDEGGLRSVSSTQAWGNFKLGTYTRMIQTTLEEKRKAGVKPVASCIVKAKAQYLLFFSDGSGVSVYFGRKKPECFSFQYPFVVSCIHVATVNDVERVFAGATDGYVYELNKGTSFDGQEINAFVQFPFSHHGSPQLIKRATKVEFLMEAGPDAELASAAEFDYATGTQPLRYEDVFEFDGGGARWGEESIAGMVWTTPTIAEATAWLEGAGSNISLIAFSSSDFMRSHVLQAATLFVIPRGRKR